MHQRLVSAVSALSFGADDPPDRELASVFASTGQPTAADRAIPLDILVVDDNPNNLLAMEVALGDLAPRMVRAASGEHALKRLLEADFAVILLDVQMPNMDGFETARLIRSRERTRHVPIIFVTAFSQMDADIRRGYELGAVDFLFKPVVPEVLKAKVQVFVELRERSHQVARQEQQLREMERVDAERRLQDERRKWEAELLRRQNHQLELADQRKDEFIAMLGHELRNPLSPLMAGVQMLRELDGRQTDFLEVQQVMERQVHHLTRLVDDLLDVSRISRGKVELQVESIEMGPLVERAMQNCRSSIEEKQQTLTATPPPKEIELIGDPVRLTQVITNLLSNASRYTPEAGEIHISWGIEDGRLTLRVKDDGRGIRPELRERIFDMFVQERDGGRGLGLGLTLVKQVVELHGGTVEALSAGRDKGSEFVVCVPLDNIRDAPKGMDAPDANARSKTGAEEPLTIALVDDDDDVRHMVQILLSRWGHRVLSAGSGASGVELVVDSRPDVALLDIGLPDMDGYEVASRIREQLGAACPRLVAMTGYGQEQDRERAFAAGFDAHLVKPAKADALRAALRKGESKTPNESV